MPTSAPSPTPVPRQGPRPLPINLMAATNLYVSSNAALPLLRNGSLSLSPDLEKTAAPILEALQKANPEALARAVERLTRERAAAFIAGVERYRNHPYRRDLAEPAVVWSDGSTRLLDYSPDSADREERVPLFFVPSLINRHYILDLNAECSFLRWLAGRGFRPFSVDWGVPGPVEREYDLTDYICRRLEPALDRAIDAASAPMPVIGYCMGGLLALSLAVRNQETVNGLVLLATPWDFHAEAVHQASALANMGKGFEPMLGLLGELPVDALQMLFSGLDPFLVESKFVRFAGLDPHSDGATAFVALEDWVNDGVPLAAPVARECFAEWYGANAPARGLWRIAGEAVRPGDFAPPALVVIPAADRIVPPASAAVLGEMLPDAKVLKPRAGHIGMIVGRKARDEVWQPVADWLGKLPRD
jgi:polyhydroxyalkanoate synthase